MANSEADLIQIKNEVDNSLDPCDKFELLMKEGKDVIDQIRAVHFLTQDQCDMWRSKKQTTQIKLIQDPKLENGQNNSDKPRQGKMGIQDEGEVMEAEVEEKNNSQHLLSIVKKPSRPLISCNCIKSKCSKNYCECFTLSRKCGEFCKCTDCENRGDEVEVFDRGPIKVEEGERACNCKKSGCLKKYCECFNNGLRCSSNCKCEECRNGLEEAMQPENNQEAKDVAKVVRSSEQIAELQAKIDEIVSLVPADQQKHVLCFLEYWLS